MSELRDQIRAAVKYVTDERYNDRNYMIDTTTDKILELVEKLKQQPKYEQVGWMHSQVHTDSSHRTASHQERHRACVPVYRKVTE